MKCKNIFINTLFNIVLFNEIEWILSDEPLVRTLDDASAVGEGTFRSVEKL